MLRPNVEVGTLITVASLKSHSIKDLSRLAEKLGVSRFKLMKKDQLLNAIVRAGKAKAAKSKPKPVSARNSASPKTSAVKKAGMVKNVANARRPSAASGLSAKRASLKTTPAHKIAVKAVKKGQSVGKAAHSKARPAPPPKPRNPRIVERIQKANAEREHRKDLSRSPQNGKHLVVPDLANGHTKPIVNGRTERDRIVLMVRDAYWLHAYWEVSRASVQRAQAAMAEQWHTARPVLRLIEVDAGATTSASERVSREIYIHGGVTNWYIDVPNPPRSFRVDIGYLSSSSKFYSLARSNVVSTPNPGATETDPHWTDVAENFEKIYALSGGFSDDHTTGDLQDLFEERLRRPMKSSTNAGFGSGAERALKRERDFRFDVDAEMLIFGQTKPGGHVTIGGAPVKVKPDGSFAVRLAMPDKRQVLPLVARSVDGVEYRTIVLAVERNTKVMEPMVKEGAD